MKNLFALCLVLEILGSSANAAQHIGESIDKYLAPPYGVIVRKHSNFIEYRYYYSNNEVCVQKAFFNKKRIITEVTENKFCNLKNDKLIAKDFQNRDENPQLYPGQRDSDPLQQEQQRVPAENQIP